MKNWGYLEQKGAWISTDEEILDKLKKEKIDFPEKVQGEQKILDFLENNLKVRDFLYNMLKEEILNI